jgi:N-acetylgalactosamine-N,N'-diacetylbacillosaminyl-diphospho-undecaprenol 4-alpha-N-acetylgalactosaminyltransferase
MQQVSGKKICLFGDSLSGGGAERVMADLSHYFSSKGIIVHNIVIQNNISYSYSGELLNLGLYQTPGVLNKLRRFLLLRNYVSKHNFDFVIDFRFKNNYFQEWITNELLYDNKKIVFTIHSSILRYYIPENKFFAKLFFRKAYGITAVSDKIKNEVCKLRLAKNVERIYNPVIREYINERMNAEAAPEYKYVLAAGSMGGDIKQFDKLIDTYAVSDLPQKGIKLVILGDGKLKGNYIQQAKELGLENMVVFPGFKDNPFVYMKGAMFFVLSSKKEGLGMVLIETLACGTPVISFDCDAGPSEIIEHGVNGLLIKDQDFEELKKWMNTMAANDELYAKCKQNASGSIAKFSLPEIGEQWMKFLNIEGK